MPKYEVVLSVVADQNLDALYCFGFETWGEEQADAYYDGLLDQLSLLAENPYLFPAVDEIRAGYRRCVYRSHAIYYRIAGDVIEVMAVLGHQDVGSFFPS